MFKEIFPSDMLNVPFEMSLEWLPFHQTINQGIQKLNEEIVLLKDEDSFWGHYNKHKLNYLVYVTFSEEEMWVNNFLVINHQMTSFDYYQGLIELGKKYRKKQIVIKLSKQSLEIHKDLTHQGYVYSENNGYVLTLSYHTGLVLGGGGAKGAYQIGVWRALEEMGIHFEMISGTSVGALNGGLIVQGDLSSAEELWQAITTDKILLLPERETSGEYSINQLMSDLQRLTLTAIQSKGVSAEPLLNIIKELILPEILFSTEYDFYVVTTGVPKMEEKVISLKEMTRDNFPLWLLASSSFFPAMSATCIEGNYYIDGGYRNNVPKDVLIKQGASDIIVVDVDGPGVIKPYKTPKDVVEVFLKSSWGLGNVLLFDGNRSNWNMTLGFLETKKIFGEFRGNDYTFKKEGFKQESLKWSQQFFSYLKENRDFNEWFNKKKTTKIWEWLLKNNINPEGVSILLIESLAKKLEIQPTQVYNIDEMTQLIIKKAHQQKMTKGLVLSEHMMYSVSELLVSYIKQKSPLTEAQLLRTHYRFLTKNRPKNKEGYHLLMDFSWLVGLEALFLLFLEKRN